jgi:hypothetical protein
MRLLPQLLTSFIVLAVAGLSGAPGADAQAPGAAELPAEAVLRLGMLHPFPHVCIGQEALQRDVRVLRLAYGVGLGPAQRMAWPWFLHAQAAQVVVAAAELWPAPGVPGASAGSADATLDRWLEQAAAKLPGVQVPQEPVSLPFSEARPPIFSIQSADPWLASRFQGSAVLPFREEFGVANPCRGWPAGIEYLPGRGATEGGRVRYVLRRRAAPGTPGFSLYGFGSAQALWADFASGKLDVALADSDSLQQEPPPARWAAFAGTQQVILRWSPRLLSALAPEDRRALSLATNRPALAGAAGRGAFRAARAFFDPLLPESRAPGATLGWDSRVARQAWLAHGGAGPVQRMRLAVLSHPLLEAIARRLAGQWQATLGIAAVVERVDADRLLQAWNAGGYDALVDVVDLDDGSLQDLWSAELPGVRPRQGRSPGDPPGAEDVAAWEQRLDRELPYLPLLTHLQVVAARVDAAPDLLRRLCPACSFGSGPPSAEN